MRLDRLPEPPSSLLQGLGIGLLLFALIAAASEFTARELARLGLSEQRQETIAHAGAIRAVLESELNATAYLASGIESYILARNGQMGSSEIEAMLGALQRRGQHIRNIGVAPGNRLRFIYPVAGNEKAIGLYYPDNPQQWPAIEKIIADKTGLLAGPVQLIQGGEALIYRVPVFLEGAYWGLISTVIDTGSLFHVVDPLLTQHDIRIALRGRDASGNRGDPFYGDPSVFDNPAVTLSIKVPGGHWTLAARPNTEPSGIPPLLVRIVGLATAGAIGILACQMLRNLYRRRFLIASQDSMLAELRQAEAALSRHRQELEATVAARTAELRLANESLRQATEAAEASTQAKSAFIANMSHEIRTPMHAIMGMTHILRRKDPRPDQLERLERISKAADHLLEILDDILDISKIEAGKMEIHPRSFATNALVERLHALFADPAQHKGLKLAIDFSALPDQIVGDDTRLGQLLINYVGNALKFTEQGTISVLAEVLSSDGKTLVAKFAVTDTGIGLSAGQIARIFDAFEQGDNTTTRKYGGTGLGLAINRRLAHLMGGATGVASVPGVGSSFWFTARLGIPSEPPAES